MENKIIKKYLNNLQEVEAIDPIHEKIRQFFLKNSKPNDDQIHKFAEDLGIEHSKLEEMIYHKLGSFLGEGKSKDFKGTYDPKQVKMGIKVEMEHTSCPFIAQRITWDHLAEIPDYYTRLAKMEKDAGIEE